MTMTVWAVGGQAQDTEQGARVLAGFAVGGREGVLDQLGCRVLALSTPGDGFRVTAGRFAVNTRGVLYQSYVGAVLIQETVQNLDGPGSAGGRSDLVTLRIIDPYITGSSDTLPADPALGPYAIIEVITGVPATTKTYAELGYLQPAIALARIDYPASTDTITQAMIKDLRGGAADAAPGTDPLFTSPGAASQVVTRVVQAPDFNYDLPFSQQTFVTWPAVASFSDIGVPPWADRFDFEFSVMNAKQIPTSGQSSSLAHLWGETRLYIGGYVVAPTIFHQDYIGNGLTVPLQIPCGGAGLVPADLRGKRITVRLEARSYNDANIKGTARFTKGAYAKLWMHFKASPLIG